MRIERILDVNQNRCAEGLRVLEEYCRFIIEDEASTAEFRTIRHFIRKNLSQRWVLYRDSESDIGKAISSSNELDKKETIKQLIRANFCRVTESMRVLEEYLKVNGDYSLSKQVEGYRFECYQLEKHLIKDYLISGLYALTAKGTKEEILNQVDLFIKHDIKWIQYRDKERDYEGIKEVAFEIMNKIKGTDTKLIINDYPKIVVEVKAHGVHVGQNDNSVKDVRKIAPNIMVGVSTHNREQFNKAVEDNPDYIALGPIFKTNSKDNPESCEGLSFAKYARQQTDIPLVGIGGINKNNLLEVKALGIDSFAMIEALKTEEGISDMVKGS